MWNVTEVFLSNQMIQVYTLSKTCSPIACHQHYSVIYKGKYK